MNNIEFLAGTMLQTSTSTWLASDTIWAIAAYIGLTVIFAIGVVIVVKIAKGIIPINTLLEEHGGGASMSRFQLLVFTFVIAFSLLLVVVHNKDFPKDIPTNVLLLLGISGSTYGVSKGIQASADMPRKGGPSDGNPPKPIGQ